VSTYLRQVAYTVYLSLMNGKQWSLVSGVSWFAMGAYLLMKGLKLLKISELESPALILWICVSLLAGFIKGRTVLAKSVKRVVAHLSNQKSPIHFFQAYDKKYYFILATMMGLGMLMRFLPIPVVVKGIIDVTIGSALINGAMLYFREEGSK
jgi:hypothetical protein